VEVTQAWQRWTLRLHVVVSVVVDIVVGVDLDGDGDVEVAGGR
jgi:hypothetical protein